MTPTLRHVHFTAMGCAAHIAVSAPSDSVAKELLRRGVAAVEALEAAWSRFRSDSDVTRVNDQSGRWVVVGQSTFEAVQLAVCANTLTEGRFDALVGGTLRDNGYARSFLSRPERRSSARTRVSSAGSASVRRPSMNALDNGAPSRIDLDPDTRSIMVTEGAHLDLGGLGKGYAGDRVCAELLAAGADGVMVNLGGDVTVAGHAPGGVWHVEVDLPAPVGRISVLLDQGAIAVSATSMRTWENGGRRWHHLIVPATRTPAVFGGAAAVIAGCGWWAEAVTKVALCGGGQPGVDGVIDVGHGAHAIVVSEDGAVSQTPHWSDFVTRPGASGTTVQRKARS